MNISRKLRVLSLALVFAMLICMIPSFEFTVKAATHTFNSGPVVISPNIKDDQGNQKYQDGDTIIIEQGVFSVTIDGLDVNVIFGTYGGTGVTIDRSDAGNNIPQIDDSTKGTATIAQLYQAGQYLGWTRTTGGTDYYVPTAPFLITGGANVNAVFYGECVFRAGTNGVYLTQGSTNLQADTTANTGYRGGYAGIQVDGDSSLTITNADNLSAYGAYQNKTSGTSQYSYNGDPASQSLSGPSDTQLGGGAGIGGGVSYAPESVGKVAYTQGTPGDITILNGKVTAYGGHCAAGIGGGLNSAATTGAITLLGGNITAHGGCWAAGIGEGDSVKNATSEMFTGDNVYEIIIGGTEKRDLTVTAYGGYCSSGIGTTDEITNNSQNRSRLAITIYSGTINATSGKGKSSAAAIGAGEATDMRDNMIAIYSDAHVSAASFSQYAINNHGVNGANIPTVNLDPNSYMYLARFAENSSQRTFKLYPVKHNSKGHPILVNISAAAIMAGSEPTQYYALDTDEHTLYAVDENGEPTGEAVDTNGVQLSYWFDQTKVIKEYVVPAGYKAIALTLPHPAEYGGAYVLEAPNARQGNQPVYSVIKKYNSGVTSGAIAYQSDYHLSADEAGKLTETPNMYEDDVAKPLTDLHVGVEGKDNALVWYGKESHNECRVTTNLITFSPSTYVYTIYLEPGQRTFYLDFTYDPYNDNKELTVSSITLDIRDLDVKSGDITIDTVDANDDKPTLIGMKEYGLQYGTGGHGYMFEVPEGQAKTDLWIRKNDVATVGTSPYVVYRIEVIVKEAHGIQLNDLTKTYDGTPVVPSYSHFAEETIGFHYTVTDSFDSPAQGENGYKIETTISSNAASPTSLIENATHQFSGSSREWSNTDWVYIETTITETLTFNVSMVRVEDVIRITTDISHECTTHTDRENNWGQNVGTPETTTHTHERIVVTEINYVTGRVKTTGESGALTGHLELKVDCGHVIADLNIEGETIPVAYAYVSLIDNRTAPAVEHPIWNVEVEIRGNQDSVKDQEERAKAIEDAEHEARDYFGLSTTPRANIFDKNYSYPKERKTLDSLLRFNLFAGHDATAEKRIYTLTGGGNVMGNFNYTAYMRDGSHVISLDVDPVEYTFYEDVDHDHFVCDKDRLLDGPPTDAGNYIVVVEMSFPTYDLYGEAEFEIKKASLNVVGIENYVAYVEKAADATALGSEHPKNISEAGDVYYFGLIGDDTVEINPEVDFFYNDPTIGYSPTKITLQLEGSDWLPVGEGSQNANGNYIIDALGDGVSDYTQVLVPGEIAFKVTGAIFKKEDDGMSPWHKFWPTSDPKPLDFTSGTDTRIDYHSPNNQTHKEVITLRTVNMGDDENRYSVDLIVGAMNFTYSKEVWDVNQHKYVSVEESIWSGNDGSNNIIQIENHSNRDVYYTIKIDVDSFYGVGIDAALVETNSKPVGESETEDNGEIPFCEKDTDQYNAKAYIVKRYLYLSGVPQNPVSSGASTGTITITIAPTQAQASADLSP